MRFALVISVLVLGGVLVSACAFPYYTQAIGGQIGLLRLLWGSDYQWKSEDIVSLAPR